MSLSLEIRNGDLALNGNSFATVSGSQKMEQDLRCAILTPYGYYEVWPEFGSTLDDGISDSVIGQSNWEEASLEVQAELNRIISNYQRQQINRNEFDAARFGRMTLTADEMVLEVESMKMIRVQDYLLVTVFLKVGNGTIKVALPLSTS